MIRLINSPNDQSDNADMCTHTHEAYRAGSLGYLDTIV
jgi:hypothetical protein